METQSIPWREKVQLIVRFLRGSIHYFVVALLCACLGMVFNALTPQVIRLTVDSILGAEQPSLPAFLQPLLPLLQAQKLHALWLAAAAVLLLALTLLLGGSQGLSLGRTGAYLLAPYLLTAWGSLWLSRRLRGREVLYGATALAALASGSYSAAVFLADDLFALGALPWWSLAVALLAAALIVEGIAFAKRIKEDTWNLSFET